MQANAASLAAELPTDPGQSGLVLYPASAKAGSTLQVPNAYCQHEGLDSPF